MIYRLTVIVYLLINFENTGISQDFVYARSVVDTLASAHFMGRGYVNDGDKLAAEYIAEEFEKIGLSKFKKSYFQKFFTTVNTFPASMNLKLNDTELIAGVDFLIEPGSLGIKGRFETISLAVDDMLNQDQLTSILKRATGKFIVVSPFNLKDYDKEKQNVINEISNFIKYNPQFPGKGSIFLTHNKLTWSGSTEAYTKPSFTVKFKEDMASISTIEVEVDNKFISKHQAQNVVGYVKGKQSDSLIVFVAHYDHLGMMGDKTYFPGANDNASGTAMLLSLAKHYESNTPQYNTVFIAFGAEEIGLLGSQYFVKNPLFQLSKIKFLINFDLAGTGEEGIQVVNGSVYRNKFNKLKSLNDKNNWFAQVKIRGEACNSDHCLFHMQGVPCLYIYTLGGIQAYHDIYDKPETLPLTKFESYHQLITAFIDGL